MPTPAPHFVPTVAKDLRTVYNGDGTGIMTVQDSKFILHAWLLNKLQI